MNESYIVQAKAQEERVVLVKLCDDGYTELSEALKQGLDYDGYHVYYQGWKCAPFAAIEVLEEDSVQGSASDSAVLRTLSGKAYRPVR